MIKKFTKISALDIIFIIQLLVVGLVITGILPRSIMPYFVVVLIIYALTARLDDTAVFFVRSIPLFIAIPITTSYDSFNTWRILSVIIFLRWAFQKNIFRLIIDNSKMLIKSPRRFIKENKFTSMGLVLFLLALISIPQSQGHIIALKRLFYFINLSLIGFVIYGLMGEGKDLGERLIKNLAVPVIIVTTVGFIQLAMTYFVDIYQFVDIWGKGIECRLFGEGWCYIVVHVGNTWFSYFGNQLSLRMFSLFPDSHSFPIFLLLGLPSIFALSLTRVIKSNNSLKSMMKTRASLLVVFVPLIFLAAILSGTRGIWAASLGGVLAIIAVIILLVRQKQDQRKINIFKYSAGYIILFFILFGLAYPIMASPQFLLSKDNSLLLENRIESILDFGETSNSQRITIWKASIRSIIKHPLIGVGIGNFPVVLGQDLSLSRAGSSAHNLYLNIVAEMGILAIIISLLFLWLLIKKAYTDFISSGDPIPTIYYGTALIFIPWVLFYSLTDVAIFDERAFLLFVVTISLILGVRNNSSPHSERICGK